MHKKVHQFLTSIQDDGTCKITKSDGAYHRVMIDNDTVSQALKFIHGDHNVSSMKLSLEEKKLVFKMRDEISNKMVYANLIN